MYTKHNTDYGRIIYGESKNRIEYATSEVTVGETTYSDPEKNIYAQAGFYPIIRSERPVDKPTKRLDINYILDNDIIRQEWMYIDLDNDEIKTKRKTRYRIESDELYLLAIMEKTRGNESEHNRLLSEWTSKCQAIKNELPYNTY